MKHHFQLPRLACAVLVMIAFVLLLSTNTPAEAQSSTPPAIQSLNFNPKSVDVTQQNATVTFNMNVTAPAGIENVYVYLSNGSQAYSVTMYDSTYTTGLTGTLQNASLTANLTIYNGSPPGAYNINSIYLRDLAGNITSLGESDLTAAGFPTVITVVNNPCAPVLTGLTFTPSVDVTSGSKTVTFSVSAKDMSTSEQCGITYVLVSFGAPASCTGPEGKSALVTVPTSGTIYSGVWTGSVTIPQDDVVGNWSVSVEVHDTDGMYAVYHAPDLQALGLPAYLTVTGPDACNTATDSISGTVHICTLAGTGVSGVTLTLYDSNKNLVGTTKTDANGNYTFSKLIPGTYSLMETVPAGDRATSANPGSGSGGTVVSTTEIKVAVAGSNTVFTPNDFVVCPVCTAGQSCITADFNCWGVCGGNYVWFRSVCKPTGLSCTVPTKIYCVNQTISYKVNGKCYIQKVPDSTVVYNPNSCTATSRTSGCWVTATSTNACGNAFLSGVAVQVPSCGWWGGCNTVTWCGQFFTDNCGVKLNWACDSDVFGSSTGTLLPYGLGIKACDDPTYAYNNWDAAGTPEAAKQFWCYNWNQSGCDGGWLGSQSVTPCVANH